MGLPDKQTAYGSRLKKIGFFVLFACISGWLLPERPWLALLSFLFAIGCLGTDAIVRLLQVVAMALVYFVWVLLIWAPFGYFGEISLGQWFTEQWYMALAGALVLTYVFWEKFSEEEDAWTSLAEEFHVPLTIERGIEAYPKGSGMMVVDEFSYGVTLWTTEAGLIVTRDTESLNIPWDRVRSVGRDESGLRIAIRKAWPVPLVVSLPNVNDLQYWLPERLKIKQASGLPVESNPSAEHAEQPALTYSDALALYRKHDLAAALSAFRRLAEQGNALGQVALANMYLNGSGVDQDVDEAISWLSKAAHNGSSPAKYSLGRAYLMRGEHARALGLLRESARQRNTAAMLWLGFAHEKGWGCEPDIAKAITQYAEAAEAGNLPAKLRLAKLATEGRDPSRSRLAGVWLTFSSWAQVLIELLRDRHSERLAR